MDGEARPEKGDRTQAPERSRDVPSSILTQVTAIPLQALSCYTTDPTRGFYDVVEGCEKCSVLRAVPGHRFKFSRWKQGGCLQPRPSMPRMCSTSSARARMTSCL